MPASLENVHLLHFIVLFDNGAVSSKESADSGPSATSHLGVNSCCYL